MDLVPSHLTQERWHLTCRLQFLARTWPLVNCSWELLPVPTAPHHPSMAGLEDQ